MYHRKSKLNSAKLFIKLKKVSNDFYFITLLLTVFFSVSVMGASSSIPDIGKIEDQRLKNIRTEKTEVRLRNFSTREEWDIYRERLRKHVLISYGLWPPPDKTPLNVKVFGAIVHEDYKVSKVVFESIPGFFVCGNLYEPVNKKGPFPVILNPHGHWKSRFRHDEYCSIPARCIGFARQGYIAFSWSMVGFDDMDQISHRCPEMADIPWGISFGGLQLWNSIRAIDWIETLENADPDRIGCTGASGGAQRTFFLGALDDRIKITAPVAIVSTLRQGGCPCANAFGLRINTNNIEITSVMAPKPQILVGATGDWTRYTMQIEYPAVKEIYKLYNSASKVEGTIVDAPHNYNRDSRNRVFKFFGKHFLGIEDSTILTEKPIPELTSEGNFLSKDIQKKLLIFNEDNPRPDYALKAEEIRDYLVKETRKKIESFYPENEIVLNRMREQLLPVYMDILAVSEPRGGIIEVNELGRRITHPDYKINAVEVKWIEPSIEMAGYAVLKAIISRKGTGEQIPLLWFKPQNQEIKSTVDIVIHPEGKKEFFDVETEEAKPLVKDLLFKGHHVISIDCFLTGEFLEMEEASDYPDNLDDVNKLIKFSAYNIMDDAWRVQDILTTIAFCKGKFERINLVGLEGAGVWCLVARPLTEGINRTVIDIIEFDLEEAENWKQWMSVPGIRRGGGLRLAGALTAPAEILIHNTGDIFPTDWISKAYYSADASLNLTIYRNRVSNKKIVEYLTK
jgi:dienelactone hydrolase